MSRLIVLLVIVVVALIILAQSAYVVDERQQVVVTRFGRPVRTVTEPGLYFLTPFVETPHVLDKRLLPWDGDPENMPTQDKKMIHVDVWARWRIADPDRFFVAARTEQRGQKLLDDIIDAAVRRTVARYRLIDLVRSTNRPLQYESPELAAEQATRAEQVTAGRLQMEQEILRDASEGTVEKYGLEIVAVRFKRINYIEAVRPSIYDRMRSERTRIAELLRSEAREESDRILGETEREVQQITGEMQRRAAEIRGKADAEVIRIYADAIQQDPAFYAFLRQLEAYRRMFGKNTQIVLTTDNAMLRLLQAGPQPSSEADLARP